MRSLVSAFSKITPAEEKAVSINVSKTELHVTTHITTNKQGENISYYMNSWLWFCAQCHLVWSLSRSCWDLSMSAGERISSGSPSWIQPTATDSGPFPREEIPGGQRVRSPAKCPSSPVSCWRPSLSKPVVSTASCWKFSDALLSQSLETVPI